MVKKGSKTDTEKVQDTLEYIRNQMELLIYKEYRIRFKGKLYANKQLKKQRKYSAFSVDENGDAIIDLEWGMLLGEREDKNIKHKKDIWLRTAYRESVRYAIYKNTKEIPKNGDEIFEKELARLGVISYGTQYEMGMELYTYICANCSKVQALRLKPLPKSKDVSAKDSNKRTPCCNDRYVFIKNKIYYSNKDLQNIAYHLKKEQNNTKHPNEV